MKLIKTIYGRNDCELQGVFILMIKSEKGVLGNESDRVINNGKYFHAKKHYSSTSIFTVLRVCTLRTRTYTRINQSSSDETMMQQTTTTKTTQWIINIKNLPVF